jgi:N6-adenosine-specific RNA methylase IME4
MPSLKDPILTIKGVQRHMNDIKPAQMDVWLKECAAAFPIGKKFQVVMCDPAWMYAKTYEKDGKKLDNCAPYPTLSMDALCAIPVRKIMDTTAVVLIWSTGPKLMDSKRLFDAWRVKYSTVFIVWEKRQRDGVTPHMNVGWWTRSSVEFLLCGSVGSGFAKWRTTKSLKQEWPVRRPRVHSQKPREIIDAVRDFMNVPNRIELFARTDVGEPDRKHWSSWGLETSCGKNHFYCQSPGYLEGAALKAWKASNAARSATGASVAPPVTGGMPGKDGMPGKGNRREMVMDELELPDGMPTSSQQFRITRTGDRFALHLSKRSR